MTIFSRLKSAHIFKAALIALLLFSGCSTLGTLVRDEANYSQNIPIEKKPTFLFFGESLTLNGYSLRFQKNTPGGTSYTILSTYSRNVVGRRYGFSKDGNQQYIVDVVSSDRGVQLGSISVTYDIEVGIVLTSAYSKEEFKVNLDEQQPYVLFYDSNLGEVKFDYYNSRNKNAPEMGGETLTGFRISVNDEEYGILAFYPASLYIRNNAGITDKMALYVLSAYASYLHNEYK
jgi:hypothetical protein